VGVWGYGSVETCSHSHTPTLPHALSRARASGLAAAMVLVATILRFIPWLTNYPLHRDEALYGYWARLIASGRDPLLLIPWIDKPPLGLYLSAASIRAFGVSELALRLPGIIASLLTVVVTFGFARRAYDTRVALVAAGLVALSPFAILFAPTAFTDPWLTLWLVAAAWAALARRPFLAGLLLGLAVASKQQGVLGVPLVLALLLMQNRRGAGAQGSQDSPPPLRSSAPPLLRSILGFALIFAPLTYWDSLRWVNRPSFWDRSLATYGQLALAPLTEWPQRAADWATQLGYLFGLPALSALMLLVAATVGVRALLPLRERERSRQPAACDIVIARGRSAFSARNPEAIPDLRRRLLPEGIALAMTVLAGCMLPASWITQSDKRESLSSSSYRGRRHSGWKCRTGWQPVLRTYCLGRRVDAVLALYTAGYLALHFAVTFQPWDRYLLPILPLVCVLAARGLVLAWQQLAGRSRLQRPLGSAVLLLLVPALLYASWLGAAGRLPVGSDHGAYAGLDQAITILRKQAPDAVIYHRWLSWHYDFYLFDAPQERRWWGSGWKLAADAARTARTEPGRPQWVVLPAWERSAVEELRLPLASSGLALDEIKRIYRPDNSRSFTLYRIAPLRAEVTP